MPLMAAFILLYTADCLFVEIYIDPAFCYAWIKISLGMLLEPLFQV